MLHTGSILCYIPTVYCVTKRQFIVLHTDSILCYITAVYCVKYRQYIVPIFIIQ